MPETEDVETEPLPESELKMPVRRATLEDFAVVTEDPDPRTLEVIREYFGKFCAPVYENTDDEAKQRQVCPSCGVFFGGMMANLGLGVGIEWGLVHGMGYCSGCHYPYRGHHFVYDPNEPRDDPETGERREPLLTIHNLFLAYHPSELRRNKKK